MPQASLGGRLGVGLALLFLFGCASGGSELDVPVLPRSVRQYLLHPLGTGLHQGGEAATAVAEGFEALTARGEVAVARATAERLLETEPGFRAAALLAAQADFVAGELSAARERLAPWAAGVTQNDAVGMLWARVAELEGDAIAAYTAYDRLAAEHDAARRGALATYERAVAQVEAQLIQDLESDRLADAAKQVDLLRSWEPDGSLRTLDASRRLARARGDGEAELRALRGLVAGGRNERRLAERRAELEMELGEPEAGLRAYETLLEADPEDAGLVSKLANAQIRWRLRLLPDDVQALAAHPDLSRADFAALLFWVVPGVRQSTVTSARIASDILDHERRGEIVRVLNRGLMIVDARRHEFGPDRTMTRAGAFRSLLEVIRLAGNDGCLVAEPAGDVRADASCREAVACDILAQESACRAEDVLSGDGAVTLLGRTLARLSRD